MGASAGGLSRFSRGCQVIPFQICPGPSPGLLLELNAEPTPGPTPPGGKKVQWPSMGKGVLS